MTHQSGSSSAGRLRHGNPFANVTWNPSDLTYIEAERQRRLEQMVRDRIRQMDEQVGITQSGYDSWTETLRNAFATKRVGAPKSKYLFDTVDQVLDSQETAIFELNKEIEGLKLLVQTMREREEERLRDSWTS